MGSIGGPELLLILVLAFLLFGPRKLPEIGRSLGKAVGEFRRATAEFRVGIEREIEMEKVRDVRTSLEDAGREMRAGLGAAPEPVGTPGLPPPRAPEEAEPRILPRPPSTGTVARGDAGQPEDGGTTGG